MTSDQMFADTHARAQPNLFKTFLLRFRVDGRGGLEAVNDLGAIKGESARQCQAQKDEEDLVQKRLKRESKKPLRERADLVDDTQDLGRRDLLSSFGNLVDVGAIDVDGLCRDSKNEGGINGARRERRWEGDRTGLAEDGKVEDHGHDEEYIHEAVASEDEPTKATLLRRFHRCMDNEQPLG